MERQNDTVEMAVEANGSSIEPGAPIRPKPYLSIRELSALTPWTEQAIRTMMAKGVLKEGEHFFHVGRRTVLKWDAIVGFIERREQEKALRIPLKRGGFVGGSEKA
jgi:hypothetical protein